MLEGKSIWRGGRRLRRKGSAQALVVNIDPKNVVFVTEVYTLKRDFCSFSPISRSLGDTLPLSRLVKKNGWHQIMDISRGSGSPFQELSQIGRHLGRGRTSIKTRLALPQKGQTGRGTGAF